MEKRPVIKIKLTPADKAAEIAGWLLLIAFWILTISRYSNLPDTIPTHYNAAGKADAFGSKISILALPLIASVIFAALSVLNRFPHTFNYLSPITPENALRQYTIATRMLRYLKLSIVLIFGLIALQTIRYIDGHTDGLGIWFLPMIIIGTVLLPIVFLVKATNER